MVGYALIEWDVDKSLSIVPLSRLQSRKGTHVTQKWLYAGLILDEGGELNCLLLNADPSFLLALLRIRKAWLVTAVAHSTIPAWV